MNGGICAILKTGAVATRNVSRTTYYQLGQGMLILECRYGSGREFDNVTTQTSHHRNPGADGNLQLLMRNSTRLLLRAAVMA